MAITPIFFAFHLQQHVWARAYLNDLPAYKSKRLGPDSESGTANDLLVPGENTLSVEVLQVEKVSFDEQEWSVRAEVYEVMDLDEKRLDKPIDRRVIHFAQFPQMYDTVAQRHRRLPFYYRATFDPGVDLIAPPWLAAPGEEFDCGGTPELREAVSRIHDAVAKCDPDAFMYELQLKLDHYEKAHGGHPETTVIKAHDYIREVFEAKPVAAPLNFDELHFEPLHGGRVARVTRYDGGFAIDAPCELDPRQKIEADLLLTQHGGSWRMFA